MTTTTDLLIKSKSMPRALSEVHHDALPRHNDFAHLAGGVVMTNDLALPEFDKALISDVAMEIGKEMVAYLEMMYPDVYAAMNSGCKLSIRNHIHNDIMWAIKNRDEGEYRRWILTRKKHRRELLKQYRSHRSPTPGGKHEDV
jgi:hypothetical protein